MNHAHNNQRLHLIVEWLQKRQAYVDPVDGMHIMDGRTGRRISKLVRRGAEEGAPVYCRISRKVKGKSITASVGSVVYVWKVADINEGEIVRHLDGNLFNNRPENLVAAPRYTKVGRRSYEQIRAGTEQRELAKHPDATDEQKAQILARLAEERRKNRQKAERYRQTIGAEEERRRQKERHDFRKQAALEAAIAKRDNLMKPKPVDDIPDSIFGTARALTASHAKQPGPQEPKHVWRDKDTPEDYYQACFGPEVTPKKWEQIKFHFYIGDASAYTADVVGLPNETVRKAYHLLRGF